MLYKHYSLLPEDILSNFLKNPNLRYSCAKDLNDPLEGIVNLQIQNGPDHSSEVLNELISQIKNTTYVCSLNNSPLEPLMWSHYASSHTGFMVEYDLSSLKKIIQVKYQNTPKITELTNPLLLTILSTDASNEMQSPIIIDFVEQVISSLCSKSHHWHYENEKRMIRNSEEFINYIQEPNSYVTKYNKGECKNMNCANEICSDSDCPNDVVYFHEKIEQSTVKSIVFGVKTPQEYIEKAKSIIKAYDLQINTYKAEFIQNSYELNVPGHPTLDMFKKS
ncbi:DUF2971 domain-containing protein [Acinetobacter calcoaceticus]|uniref:DUF2971 domain-containing protein n=1 Tax=Acinetobacter calcoaceticus TaxID=471 RepID=UPI003A8C4745